MAAALLAAGLVIAHWSVGVRVTLDAGITNFDSTWYHGPFAAGFAQGHSTFDLHFIAPQFLAWFYPANSELLHGVGILAFGRDNLSPLINLGWLAGTLLAAWCIGRPYGVAPLSTIGAAVVLDAGAMADQAGSMRNDIAAIFFLTAAAAIAVNAAASQRERWLGPGALALIGLAAGLAAGVKLNYLAPALALGIGLVLISAPGTRRRASAAVGLPLLAGCGYWYLRNLLHSGSPFPWVKSLGPIDLPAPDQALGGRRQESVLGYLFHGSTWREWFLPGLHHGLGWLWPLVVAMAIGGLVLCLSRRREPLLRVLGAGRPGHRSRLDRQPRLGGGAERDAAQLRVRAALPGAGSDPRPGAAARSQSAATRLAASPSPPRSWRRLPSPTHPPLPGTRAMSRGRWRSAPPRRQLPLLLGSWRLRRARRPALVGIASGCVLVAVGVGWVEQRRYLDHRYADPQIRGPGTERRFQMGARPRRRADRNHRHPPVPAVGDRALQPRPVRRGAPAPRGLRAGFELPPVARG